MSVDRPTPRRFGLSDKEHEAIKYKAHHLKNQGLSIKAIAKEVGLSEARVYYILGAKGGRVAQSKQYKNMPFCKSNGNGDRFSEERFMLQNQKKRGK